MKITDKQRLDWLEEQTKLSTTGVGIDYVFGFDGKPAGYRIMSKYYTREPHKDLRSAIDAEINLT